MDVWAEHEALRDRFNAITEDTPLTDEELLAALLIAAKGFEAESYDSRPFRALIAKIEARS